MNYFRTRLEVELENICLRQQLAMYKRKCPRSAIKDTDRRFWVLISRIWKNWRNALVFVTPETVLRWHKRRCFSFLTRNRPQSRLGRPFVVSDVLYAIARFVKDNPRWGAPRIHGELLKLGFHVSERTVTRYMKRFQSPDRGQGWKTFLQNNASSIVAMDFFTVFTLGFKQINGFAIIDHGRRKIIHIAATHVPTTEWLVQQMLSAFPGECPYRYIVCDNGRIFNDDFKSEVKALLNLKVVKTARYSPWQNGVMERFVGSCRREMLDHTIVLNERHLARLLSRYKDYYNSYRTHTFLCKDAPDGRPVEVRSQQKKLKRISFLGGLQSAYHW